MDKKGFGREGVSQFSVKSFLSHIAKKIFGRTLICFTNPGYRKFLYIRGVSQDFLFVKHGNSWHDRQSNLGLTAREPCCPNPTTVIYFQIKRVGNSGLKKKEKRHYWLNNFSCLLHMWQKITKGAAALNNFLSKDWKDDWSTYNKCFLQKKRPNGSCWLKPRWTKQSL